jgi:polar amino acid transport system substrate-binding protein
MTALSYRGIAEITRSTGEPGGINMQFLSGKCRGPVLALFSLFAVLAMSAPASAQTVDEIIKRGKVIIGVNTTTPIFGILGKDGQPEGYDPDVARLVGKYLGVQVEFVPVTAANRISYLLSNRIDMIIALFGITPERAQQVWYSIPYGSDGAVLVGPEKVKAKTIDELDGLRVGVPRGATQDLVLTPQAKPGTTIMRYDDEATGLQALISGQVDLAGTGMLVYRVLNRNDPGKNYEVKMVLRPLHFGIGIRKGSTELLQWLNTFIYAIKNNGELDAISRKWRELPLGELPVF